MIFSVIIPLFPVTFGILRMPDLIHVSGHAFPELNRAAWMVYSVSLLSWVLLLVLSAGPETWRPWMFQISNETNSFQFVNIILVLSTVSAILIAINVLVTVYRSHLLTQRKKDVPVFVWALVAWSGIQVLAGPVFILTIGLQVLEQFMHVGLLDPYMGGDPVLHEHLFWFYVHPSLLSVLPVAAGTVITAVSESDTKIPGQRFTIYSIVIYTVLIVLSWGSHMITSGQAEFASMVFSFFALLALVPLTQIAVTAVRSLLLAKSFSGTPVLFGIICVICMTLGIATAIALVALPINAFLHGTAFVKGHVHLFALGCLLAAFFGGLHAWWSHIFVTAYPKILARIACVLFTLGSGLAFLTQFVLGLSGRSGVILRTQPELSTAAYVFALGTAAIIMSITIILGYSVSCSFHKERK